MAPNSCPKSTKERLADVCNIAKNLKDLGISKDTNPELSIFFDDANSFIKESAYTISNSIPLRGLNRKFYYNLISTSGISSTSVLKYSPGT